MTSSKTDTYRLNLKNPHGAFGKKRNKTMIHFVKTLFGASRYKRKLTAYKKEKKERKKERKIGDTTHQQW